MGRRHTLLQTAEAHPIATASVVDTIAHDVEGNFVRKGPRASREQQQKRLFRYLIQQGYSAEDAERAVRHARSGRWANMQKFSARRTRGGWRGIIVANGRTIMKSSRVFHSEQDAIDSMRSGHGHVFGDTQRFSISARQTRGGWRGVASAGGGVVVIKTVPVFRSKSDAEKAMRYWLTKRGQHADKLRAYANVESYVIEWTGGDGRRHMAHFHSAEALARFIQKKKIISVRRHSRAMSRYR